MNISNKVAVSAATATVLAGAVATVVLALVKSRYQIDVPPDVREALIVLLGAVITGVATLAAGWFKVENNPAPSAADAVHEGKGAAS